MDLGTVAGELYGLPPGEFVSVRDLRASDAKRAGDLELAAAIKQLRRPTTGAWLANLLVRERRGEVTELLDLGKAMRRAQLDLAGSDLRRLSRQRRELVSALAAAARGIAAERGHQVNASSIQEVEDTLEAALADNEVGEALRSGCLTVALRYSGFGSIDLTGAVGVRLDSRTAAPQRVDPKKRTSVKGVPTVAERRRQDRLQEAEKLVAESRTALISAERAVAKAENSLATANQERSRLEERMSEEEQKLRALRDRHERSKRGEREALKNRDLADRHLKRAKGRLDQAMLELEGLRSTSS